MIKIDVSWIADLVRENTEDPKVKAPLCQAFADKFSSSDPSFKKEDFMKRCNLSFGAIDMILTPKDRYIFLEVNPNGQFGWIENLANLPISRTIAKTLRQGRD